MSLLKNREQARVDRRESLRGVPVLHESVSSEETDDDLITLRVRVDRGGGPLAIFRPPTMEKRYELDEFGSFVFRQLDNRKSVMELVSIFEKRFRMNHREAELGVVAFIKILMKRQILSVVIP